MSNFPSSPFWSRNPHIPIYPGPGNENEHICHTCDCSSRSQPIHCIQLTPSAPPPYISTPHVLFPPPAPPSRNSAVPVLSLETSYRYPRLPPPLPPRPALRFDIQSGADGRPRVRPRRSVFSPSSPGTLINELGFGRKTYSTGYSIPNTPVDDTKYPKSKLGLGILEAPFVPDPNPIQSLRGDGLSRAEKGKSSEGESTPGLIQGIERKLLEYNASSNVVKRWLLEIASWLLSALCMIAIIILLIVFQNQPVPKNWPITLDTYVAVLFRVASAALVLPASEALGQLKWSWFQGDSKKMWDFEIFDNASRGPWGAFQLLLRTKCRTLAALGALVTIFAMALDPFFQQAVQTPQRWSHTLNSSISMVTRYQPLFSQEFKDGEITIFPDQAMESVIEKVFLGAEVQPSKVGNGTRPEIPLDCPEGRCTWEPYESLSICSQCEDVADMLEFGCATANLDWTRNASIFIPYENSTMCGWFFNITSPGAMLMSGYQADPATNQSSGEILTTRLLTLVTNYNRRPLFGGSIHFKHIRNPIADFVIVSPTDGPDRESILASIFRHERPRALECVLSWCVQTIESSYFQGAYTENIKHSFTNTTAGPYPWTTFDVDDKGAGTNITLKRYFQDIIVDPHGRDGQGNASTYGASNDTAFNIIAIFDDYIPSYTTTSLNNSETTIKYKTWHEQQLRREFEKNPWLAPNNITEQVARLAKIMTNVMRQSSTQMVTGKSFSEVTYIQVRWGWLALPMALLVLTLVFLVATVLRTSTQTEQVGVWKNSSIATLLYGLPDEMQREVTTSADATPRTKARKLNMRMMPSGGWRFSGTLKSPVSRDHKPEAPPGWI